MRPPRLLFTSRCAACDAPLPAMTTTAACRQCLASLPAAAGPGDASCATCGIALISEEGQCLACRERPAHFDGNESLFAYRGATRDLIRAYKFDGRLTLSGWFAQALAARLDPCDHDVVVPAPARPAGTRRRGYDHMALIAQQLGRRHRLAVTLALRRRRGAEGARLRAAGAQPGRAYLDSSAMCHPAGRCAGGGNRRCVHHRRHHR